MNCSEVAFDQDRGGSILDIALTALVTKVARRRDSTSSRLARSVCATVLTGSPFRVCANASRWVAMLARSLGRLRKRAWEKERGSDFSRPLHYSRMGNA